EWRSGRRNPRHSFTFRLAALATTEPAGQRFLDGCSLGISLSDARLHCLSCLCGHNFLLASTEEPGPPHCGLRCGRDWDPILVCGPRRSLRLMVSSALALDGVPPQPV